MFNAPRGTTDILPADQPYWRYVIEHAERLCRLYGYGRIDTPLFEESGLFKRGIGEGTDIVEKETYDFEDRNGEWFTLKPEGTAPVCRAYLEHGMHNLPQPVKLYYVTPFFRYERPQAGRYRQFHQFGVEVIGEQDPAVDAEVIKLAWDFATGLGLSGLTVLLNSIGDSTCRPAHLRALVEYYEAHRDEICADCKVRLVKNPLRLLDCKVPSDQPIIAGAPKTINFLCDECREHFARTREYLEAQGVPYQIEHRLVRGLDYYTKTVFEIVPEDGGSTSTVGGGGRYDGLMEALGGRPTPGIGFGIGIERMVLNLKKQAVAVPDESQPQAFVAYLGSEAKLAAVRLTETLRSAGVRAWLSTGDRSLRAQLRHANTLRASEAVILGEEEMRAGTAVLRHMESGEQETVPREALVERLAP